MSAPASNLSTGAHMVADDGRPLPLLGVELRAHAEAGLARVTLRQQFQNPYDEPLRVRYLVPLPADAAVGGYCFELPAERIVGEIARKQDARERFERAIIQGRSAALLEQQRSSVFDQEVGNIPPGALVTTELTIDQPLTWLAEGAWEWRFPTVVAPRYMAESGRVADAAKLGVPVLDGPVPAGAALALTISDPVRTAPHSPSHALSSQRDAEGWTIGIAGEAGSAPLDRDVVVRWGVAAHEPGITVSLARREGDDRALGLLTIVPPEPTSPREAVPRDLILLIDVSGSMGGEPLDQAKRVIQALLAGLGPKDRLEMIAFASQAIRWRREPAVCDAATLRSAVSWVSGLRASGGTNMHTAIIDALAPLRDDAQRQILLISDGLIGFEQEIIGEAVRRLPSRSRVHCLGVGHGVNRSLTRPLAHAGHGVELIVAPGEDAEKVVGALLERTVEPLLVGLELDGPAVIPFMPASPGRSRGDLFAGTPTRVAIACWPEGGRLTLRARSAAGEWVEHVTIPETPAGSGDPALLRHFAREQIEDIETSIAAGMASDGDARIEALGLRYGVATRMTSWIAVSEKVTVDPTAPSRTVEQPHELPAGMSAEGVGLRRAQESSVVRNQDGVIVGLKKRGKPQLLGAINLPGAPVPAAPAPGSTGKRYRRPRPSAVAEEMGEAQGTRAPRQKGRATTSASPRPESPSAPSDRGAGGEDLEFDDLADEPEEKQESLAEQSRSVRERVGEAIGKLWSTKVLAAIILEQDGQLVLSFVTPKRLDWSPSGELALRVNGKRLRAKLDPAATTKPGTLDEQVTVRLALILDVTLPPGKLELELCGLKLVVER